MPEPTDRPQVSDLESALRTLRPRADLDREALMYHAGRACARGNWAWQLAAGGSTTLAAVLGLLLLTRPAAPVVERIVVHTVYVPAPPQEQPAPPSPPPEAPATSTTSEPSAWQSYLSPHPLHDHVLRWGLDGLPPAPDLGPRDSSETPAGLLRSQ
jgi:hypothetical protein